MIPQLRRAETSTPVGKERFRKTVSVITMLPRKVYGPSLVLLGLFKIYVGETCRARVFAGPYILNESQGLEDTRKKLGRN